MKKLGLQKEIALMNEIERREKAGEMNFSNMNGDDGYYGEDNYVDLYSGPEGYGGGLDSFAGTSNGKGPGMIKAPQRTIKFTLQNKTGIAPAHAATDITVQLFNANTNTLPGRPALGLLNNNPTFNAVIDGYSYIGDAANPTFVDLIMTGRPATYSQILAESKNSPYEVQGNKIFCSTSQQQLTSDYNTIEVDLLGRSLTVPYTPSDKLSAFQFSSTIIEDPEFRLKLDGNQGINYLIYAPGNGGTTAGVINTVTFCVYLIAQVEANRILGGKNPAIVSPTRRMPNAVQQFKLQK